MVVGCPKCQTKLKIPDEKIAPQGTKFKCPKCATLLLVRPPKTPAAGAVPAAPRPAAPQPAPQLRPAAAPQPAPRPAAPQPAPRPAAMPGMKPATPPPGAQLIEAQAKEINTKKILVAHENASIVEKVMMALLNKGYLIIPASSGVDAQVQAMKELPHVVIVDANLPKTNGFEIVKRLREKPEAKGIKAIVLTSKTDAARARKNPAMMYGVDVYLDDDVIDKSLFDALDVAKGVKRLEDVPALMPPMPAPAAPAAAAPRPVAPAAPAPRPAAAAPAAGADREVEKAKRLARTVLSDIDLYSPDKVSESIKNGSFQSVFAEELREGLKHYQNRIPQEVRNKGNFFQLAIDDFIEKKKKAMGMA